MLRPLRGLTSLCFKSISFDESETLWALLPHAEARKPVAVTPSNLSARFIAPDSKNESKNMRWFAGGGVAVAGDTPSGSCWNGNLARPRSGGGEKPPRLDDSTDDLGRANPATGNPSRLASRNAYENDTLSSAEAELSHLHGELASKDVMTSNSSVQGSSAVQNVGLSASYSYGTALGASLSRSTTPESDPPLQNF